MNNRILTIAASSLIAGTAMADYTGLTSTGANNGDGTWTVRIYVNFDVATDELHAVFGDADDSLFISSNGAGFYQNPFVDPTSKSINPAFYPMFPSLLLDSWVTICLEDMIDNNMLNIGIDWSGLKMAETSIPRTVLGLLLRRIHSYPLGSHAPIST